MPTIDLNGATIYYEDTPGSGTPIVFSHGLLWSCRLFDPQVRAFAGTHRCIAFDHRGQGQSVAPGTGTIPVDQCYEDAVALIEKLGLGPVHFVGLSMGGFVGMRMAARRPDLVKSLILLETSSEPEPEANVPRYRLLGKIARYVGIWAVEKPVMRIMFSRSFLTDPARAEERRYWSAMLRRNKRDIWRALNGVIDRKETTEELASIRVPTLVGVGEEDVATVPAKAERIHAAIAGSQLVRFPKAGHSSSVENPAAVNAAISEFLAKVESPARSV